MAPDKDYKSGIDWIDQHASLRAVYAPLEKGGGELDDNLIFEEIESEMMKRGTLAHNSIRWDFVFEQTLMLLREEAKDFRLLAFLIQALPQLSPSPSLPSPLALATHLVASFVTQWAEVATPQGRAATRALTRLGDALETLVKRVEETGLESLYRASIVQDFAQTAQALLEKAPDSATKFTNLSRRIEKIETETHPAPTPEPSATAQSSQSVKHPPSHEKSAVAATSAPRPSDLTLDSTNERALRESLAKMADFLFDLDHRQPLSYRLRRYAGWYGMREQPALKKDAATIILPPSEESLDLYRQAVAQKQTDVEIAKRLERSCYLQPFWIEGHYLAWNLARARQDMPVAHAIFEEVGLFVKAAPWLYKLQFSSQMPFIPDDVQSWLANHQTTSNTVTPDQASGGGRNVLDDARALAESGDMIAAIKHMEAAQTTLGDLRERSLWEIASLELLSEWGLKTHAAASATRLEDAIRTLTVADWDGPVFERLHRLKSATV